MMFFKLFCHDADSGIRKRCLYYLMLVVAVTIFCQECYMKVQAYQYRGLVTENVTWMDYLAFLFQGMEVYIPGPENPFVFPVMWVLIFLFSAYATLSYPFDDLTHYGQQILIRSGGRGGWWLSKCLWNLCSSLLYFGIFYGVTLLFCLYREVPISLQTTPDLVKELIQAEQPVAMGVKEGICLLIVMPVLVSAALNLLQMMLGLFLKPLFSFGIVSSILILSAYYKEEWSLGNHTMLLRSRIVLGEEGVSPEIGVVLSVSILLLSALLGKLYFKKYDILSRE